MAARSITLDKSSADSSTLSRCQTSRAQVSCVTHYSWAVEASADDAYQQAA